jgi:hypothetical protein
LGGFFNANPDTDPQHWWQYRYRYEVFVLLLLLCLVDLFLRALSARCCQPSQTTRPGGHHHFSARFWHCTHIRPLSQFSKGGQGAVLPPTFCPRMLYIDSATCLKKTKTEINNQVQPESGNIAKVVVMSPTAICVKNFNLDLKFKPFLKSPNPKMPLYHITLRMIVCMCLIKLSSFSANQSPKNTVSQKTVKKTDCAAL